jgi:hypothetical protein
LEMAFSFLEQPSPCLEKPSPLLSHAFSKQGDASPQL